MKSQYHNPDKNDILTLSQLVGKHNILTEKLDIEGYSYDESPSVERFYPQIVIKPTDTLMVSKVLAFANERKLAVTPRGAGTGISGGATPVYGGIVISLEKMDRIIEIDDKNFVAVVEPGVTLVKLRSELETHSLDYSLYPGELNATIGGNVATNAGGMNAVKYGVTRNHILGLEMVLADGRIINSGGKYVKCTTGYDLTQLVIGSEGTLAIVTKILLKLTCRKPNRNVMLLPFTKLQEAINAVPEILSLPVVPVGLEFMERDIIKVVENFIGWEMPHHDFAAYLFIIMDGENREEVVRYFQQVNELCLKHGAGEGLLPDSESARKKLLQMREKFFPAIKAYSKLELIDTVVPRSEIAGFMVSVRSLSNKYNIPIIGYGHAGDGNIHLHLLQRGLSESGWQEKLPALMQEIYKVAIEFGGAISGEHGVGFTKKKYLPIQFNNDYIETLISIKKAFDPNNILNPGKIF